MKNIYREKGYESREEYLLSLAEEFEIDLNTVKEISYLLGSNEDFDGLPASIEDYVSMYAEMTEFEGGLV